MPKTAWLVLQAGEVPQPAYREIATTSRADMWLLSGDVQGVAEYLPA